MVLYRGMDRAQLDAAYNNRQAVPTYEAIASRRRQLSEHVRRSRQFHADLAYGPGARQRLDVFPAKIAGSPLLAFIHGGYWQTNDKEASTFLVEGPLERGIAVALIEYTLAPEADIDSIVGEAGCAVDWLLANASELGADPRRLYLAGHSAGGHLTAMMLERPIAGALAISGLYDLEPIRLCYLNEKLRLTEKAAFRNSPKEHPPQKCPATIVAVGANELPELVRQSREYGERLVSRGLPVEYVELPGHDHFSILDELAQPRGALCEQIVRWAERPTT